jgi:signal transduction histidine kinase
MATDGTTPLAAIVADPSVAGDRGLLDAVVGTSRMVLENARLHADLRAQLEETRASRARIVEAARVERARVEHNLHDGAQQYLLALMTNLAATGLQTTDPATREALSHARAQLQLALDELRALARGIYPAALSQSGIAPAVEGIAERHGLPIRLDITSERFTAPLESTAYFVICEALNNTVKHAHAEIATVVVKREGTELYIEISDDGVGGADQRGSGLSALRDRVRAIRGELTVADLPEGGTQLIARIPCG